MLLHNYKWAGCTHKTKRRSNGIACFLCIRQSLKQKHWERLRWDREEACAGRYPYLTSQMWERISEGAGRVDGARTPKRHIFRITESCQGKRNLQRETDHHPSTNGCPGIYRFWRALRESGAFTSTWLLTLQPSSFLFKENKTPEKLRGD